VKRLTLTASLALAVAVPGVAQAQLSHEQTTAYGRAYVHAVKVFGPKAAGCKLIGPQATCSGPATDGRILASTDVLHRMFAPRPVYRPAPTHYSSSTQNSYHATSYGGGGSGYGDVPGVPSGFASCVAMRESTNGAGSSNIYGIEGPGGQGSLAEQKQAFAQMYADRGSQPWAPYDGC
jgi:hypothetical protein